MEAGLVGCVNHSVEFPVCADKHKVTGHHDDIHRLAAGVQYSFYESGFFALLSITQTVAVGEITSVQQNYVSLFMGLLT
jgi:hypothetical protein